MESSGHSKGNPRLFELVEDAPKTGKSPTVWAWPQLMDYLKIAGQPVAGPWPPHQEPRPDPEYDSQPVAVPFGLLNRSSRLVWGVVMGWSLHESWAGREPLPGRRPGGRQLIADGLLWAGCG